MENMAKLHAMVLQIGFTDSKGGRSVAEVVRLSNVRIEALKK